MTDLKILMHQAEDLLRKTPYGPTIVSLTPCLTSGNNRTYRLETKEAVFALKQYCRQREDTRDRLTSEYAFLSYANRVAPNLTPCPYAKNHVNGLALYEFIEGEPFKANEVHEVEVNVAAQFFCALNQPEVIQQASDLPEASEARFSIDDHIKLLTKRIKSLKDAPAYSTEDTRAKEVIQALSMRFDEVVKDAKEKAKSYGLSLSQKLSIEDRCVSPSDFGFHNAFRMADGSIRFIDFEYAGWDDPAKMVGDFFSQLAIPVPEIYYEDFTKTVLQTFPSYSELMKRTEILRPLYQVKWCCIALNIFQPVHLARRKFANPQLNEVDLKRNQIAKAELLIQKIGTPVHG